MTNATRTGGLVLAGLVMTTPAAAADTVEITQALRRVDAWVYGFDYDFDDGVSLVDQTTATDGPFDAALLADLDDWYGGHVGTSAADIVSCLGPDHLVIITSAAGTIDDPSTFQADAGGEGTASITFTADGLVRVSIEGSAARIGEGYAVADAMLRAVDGPVIASLSVQSNPAASVETVRWLIAGAYETTTSLQAWAFGGPGVTDLAEGTLEFKITVFDGGDLDLDGVVDADDLDGYLAAFEDGLGVADVNGDEEVTDEDRDLFWSAWRSATLACPGDLDASGTVDIADVLALLAAWGDCAFCPGDLDDDGTIGITDLLIALASWGPCDA